MPPEPPKCTCALSDTSPADEAGFTHYTFACTWDKFDQTRYVISVDARTQAEANGMAVAQCPFEPTHPKPRD